MTWKYLECTRERILSHDFLEKKSRRMGDNRVHREYSDSVSILPTNSKHNEVDNGSNDNYMRSEKNRLATFCNWPEDAPIEGKKLAKAGFYYLNSNFSVECFSCKGKISNWDFGDQAIVKHQNLNPVCDFVLGKSDNEPLVEAYSSLPSFTSLPTSVTSETVSITSQRELSNHSSLESSFAEPSLVDKTWDSFSSLLQEAERLKTFRNWPLRYIKPEDLACAGFFWLRDGDKAQCVFCNGIVGEWEEGDVPLEEHRKHFSHCEFIQGREVGNIPLIGDNCGKERFENNVRYCGPEKGHQKPYLGENLCLGIHRHTGPKHPSYATLESRLRTFSHWAPSIPQSPEHLAEAGFYYAGLSDHCRCFYCDGGLRNWEQDDDPWIEHARWYGNCSYVLLVKGLEYVKTARTKRPPILPPKMCKAAAAKRSSEESLSKPAVCVPEDANSFLNSDIAKFVLQAGVPLHLVKKAVENRHLASGTFFQTPEELYRECFLIENEVQQRHAPVNSCSEYQPPNCEPSTSFAVCPPVTTIKSPVSIVNGTPTEHTWDPQCSTSAECSVPSSLTQLEKKTEDLSIVEENRALKEMKMCKICMDEEVGVVFLPCGHLITCVKCATSLSDCPLCRKSIKGTVRTYFS